MDCILYTVLYRSTLFAQATWGILTIQSYLGGLVEDEKGKEP